MSVLQINEPVKVNKQIIPSIDIMRVICSLMVVAIHTNPFQEINAPFAYFIQQVVLKVAVPFFFAVSGYFLSSALIQKQDIAIVVKYFKRILFTYTLWSAIYFIIVIREIFKGSIPIVSALRQFIINYFIYGGYYHLWYFPALIFSVLVFAFFYKINKLKLLIFSSIVLYIIGLLGISYYKIGKTIPILNSIYTFSKFIVIRHVFFTALPFFVLGLVVYLGKKYFDRIGNRASVIISITIVICYVLEIIINRKLHLSRLLIITMILYVLTGWILILCIKYPMINMSKYSLKFRYISNFIFYSHPLFLFILRKAYPKVFGMTLSQTPKFFLVCILTITTAIIISKINNKYLTKLMT